MKLSKFFSLMFAAFAFGAVSTLSSCVKPADQVTTISMPGYINTIVDATGNVIASSKNVGYTITYNYNTNLADVTIEKLKMADGQQFTGLTFKEVPWRIDTNGCMIIDCGLLNPTASVQAPQFQSLFIDLYPRYFSEQFLPLVKIEYTINNQTFYSLPTSLINGGTTTVTDPENSAWVQPESEACLYMLVFDPEKEFVTLGIQGAKFASNMPAMNMKFKDIPYSVNAQGKYVFQAGLIEAPVIVGSDGSETPNPSFPISNLFCQTDGFNNMTLNFTCTLNKTLPGGTEVSLPYQVNVVCKGPGEGN